MRLTKWPDFFSCEGNSILLQNICRNDGFGISKRSVKVNFYKIKLLNPETPGLEDFFVFFYGKHFFVFQFPCVFSGTVTSW